MSLTITPALHAAVTAARDALDNLAALLSGASAQGRARRLVEPNARPFGGSPVRTWTPERTALLRERFPTSLDDAALLADLNALPAPGQIATTKGVAQRAGQLGIKRNVDAIRALRSKGGAEANKRRLVLSGGAPVKRTVERLEIVRAEYPSCVDLDKLLARINELPGEAITSVGALRKWAKVEGIFRTPQTKIALMSKGGTRSVAVRASAPMPPPVVVRAPDPEPEPEPAPPTYTPEEQAAIADAAVLSKHDRVRAGLRTAIKQRGDVTASAMALAHKHGIPPREAMRLLGEVRREGDAAA